MRARGHGLLTARFDRWSEKADFIFGYDRQPAMVRRAEALDESAWTLLERPRRTPRTGRSELLKLRPRVITFTLA